MQAWQQLEQVLAVAELTERQLALVATGLPKTAVAGVQCWLSEQWWRMAQHCLSLQKQSQGQTELGSLSLR